MKEKLKEYGGYAATAVIAAAVTTLTWFGIGQKRVKSLEKENERLRDENNVLRGEIKGREAAHRSANRERRIDDYWKSHNRRSEN